MKVKGSTEKTEFKDLKQGEAFVFEGKPYMKIQRIQTNNHDDDPNAAHLGSGHTRHFVAGDTVIAKPKASIDLDK